VWGFSLRRWGTVEIVNVKIKMVPATGGIIFIGGID